MTEAPEPLHRRRTPRVTEETRGLGYTCPTGCDDDCEAICHEGHQVPWKRMHPVEICEANHARGRRPIPEEWYPGGCSCLACDEKYWPTWEEFVNGKVGEITADGPRPPVGKGDDDPHWRVRTRMTLCPVCGFKRCPGAVDHRNRCTGSNAVGQPGSLYAPSSPIPEDEKQRRLEASQELRELTEELGEGPDLIVHTRGPLEGQPIVPETEEEKREHYLANRDDPEEWG
jgi:hypothetical protein